MAVYNGLRGSELFLTSQFLTSSSAAASSGGIALRSMFRSMKTGRGLGFEVIVPSSGFDPKFFFDPMSIFGPMFFFDPMYLSGAEDFDDESGSDGDEEDASGFSSSGSLPQGCM